MTGLRGFLCAVDPTECGALWKFEREILTVTSQVWEKEKHPQQIVQAGHTVGSPSPQKNVQKMSNKKKAELKFASSSFLLPGLVLFLAAGLEAHWGCGGVTHEGAARMRVSERKKAEVHSERKSVRESERGAALSEPAVRE